MEIDEVDGLKPIGPEILIAGILELGALRSGLMPAVTRCEARNIASRLYGVLTGCPTVRNHAPSDCRSW